MNSPQPYLTVASILTGFCISVFMFRIQHELGVRDRRPDWPNWLAWADYLIIATIILSVLLVILPLVALPNPGRIAYSIAAGSCAASSLLVLAYPFAILDHYRIEIGVWRTREGEKPLARHKRERIERIIVVTAGIIAATTFAAILFIWNG
jgi:hypothetical protein